MRYKILIALLLISTAGLFADSGEFGVKEAGMGLSGTARPLDATSVYMNPSAAGVLQANCFSAGYSRLAWGIGGAAIERGMMSYIFRRPDLGGAGLSFAMLNQDVSYYARLGLTVAPEFTILGKAVSIGATGTWYQTGYRPSQFTGHEAGPDPLFADATQKNAFGLSAGVTANLWRELSLGAALRDINEPNLALQDTIAIGARPMEFQCGLYYPVHMYFRPCVDFIWRNETINEKTFMRLRAGAEARLPRGFSVRAGYDGTGIDAGLTLRAGALFGGVDIDYAFVYPIEKDLAEVGAVSHHFGVSVWGLEKQPKRIDLTAERLEASGKITAGVDNDVIGVIRNIGKEPAGGFSVSLASVDSTGKWRVIYPAKYLDSAPIDSAITLEWKWRPPEPGTYRLRMTVDDDAREVPFINGKIDEKNKENNTIEIIVVVGPAGGFRFEIAERKANVTRLEYVVEEKPLVPVIFFEPASSELDSESVALLEIYSERMMANPDAVLNIEGFFDPSDGVACTAAAELEIQRAQAVFATLIKREPSLEPRIRIVNKIGCVEPRYRIDPAKVLRDKALIAAENRRAKLWIEFPDVDSLVARYTLAPGAVDVPSSEAVNPKAIEVLERNQDALIIVEGGFAAGEDSTVGLERAEALRKRIYNEFPRLLPGKVRIFPAWNGPQVRATLNGEGVLWAPTTSEPSVVGFENLTPETAKIKIIPVDFEKVPVDSSRVEIITTDDRMIRHIGTTNGLPPAEVSWDWRDEGGHLIKPESWVNVRVTTYSGKKATEFVSEGKEGRMQMRVKDVQRRIHRLLVVQFVFDETVPTSHFLESRLDGLAHGIVTEARAGLSPSVHLSGHTDAIGTEGHNLELSSRRANRELAILRLYIAHHLGLKSSSEIDEWLAGKNSTIDAAGYGASVPYKLMAIGPDGVELLLGDDAKPRGRTVNRRVTVEHGVDEDILKRD